MEQFVEIIRDWNKSSSERVKLQHVYILIIIVITVISGLLGLIDVELGRQFIKLAGIAAIAFLANAIVWALSQTYVFTRLERKRPLKK